MRINKQKLEIEMAKHMLTSSDLVKAGISLTLQRKVKNQDVKPVTVGRIANALGCDVTELIDME